jgi:uncharacterized protein YndB with AHSA1/START domain
MKTQFIARQSLVINTPVAAVWDALVNPRMIKQYMFGTNDISEWTVGKSFFRLLDSIGRYKIERKKSEAFSDS